MNRSLGFSVNQQKILKETNLSLLFLSLDNIYIQPERNQEQLKHVAFRLLLSTPRPRWQRYSSFGLRNSLAQFTVHETINHHRQHFTRVSCL